MAINVILTVDAEEGEANIAIDNEFISLPALRQLAEKLDRVSNDGHNHQCHWQFDADPMAGEDEPEVDYSERNRLETEDE